MNRNHRRVALWLLAAAALVACASGLLLGLTPPTVEGETPQERVQSICRIADRNSRGAADVIAAAAIGEKDPTVRRAAVACLTRFPTPACRAAVDACLTDTDPQVRAAAAGTLSGYPDERAVGQLSKLALDDPVSQVRQAAMAALGALGHPQATVTLVELMERGPDPGVQRSAAATLQLKLQVARWTAKDQREWESLVEIIKSSPEVINTFTRLNRPLNRHPERILPDEDLEHH